MGKKFATLKDVAFLSKTSIATVSYVLNDSKKRYISSELRERVLWAAEKLNYHKNTYAQNLKEKRTGIIAAIIPQFENNFFTRIASGIEGVVRENGYMLTICNSFDNPEIEKEILKKLISQRVDGYIISPSEGGEENIELIRKLGVPFVLAERPGEKKEDNFVFSDNFQAGYEATKYLIEMGHRQIAFIGWKTLVSNLKERKSGYFLALEQAKIKNRHVIETKLEKEKGREATREVLKNNKITAIFYAHHILADGGIDYFRKRGKKIPEDISIIMTGDTEWSRHIEVEISRIDQREREIGRHSAEILMNVIKNNNEKVIMKKISANLIKGKSVKNMNKKIKKQIKGGKNMEFYISAFADEVSKELDIQLAALEENRIKFIEVRGVNGKNISELSIEEALDLKRKLDEKGIKVSAIGSPIGKINIKDDFQTHLKLFEHVLEISNILETKYIRVFSFLITDGKYSESKEEVIRRLKKLVEIAEKNNKILLHENEKEIYGDIATRCFEIFQEIDSKHLRMTFDPANFIQCKQIVYPDAYELLKPYIEYFHIKDALAESGKVVPAGYGDGRILDILREYSKEFSKPTFLSIEPHLSSFDGLEKLEGQKKVIIKTGDNKSCFQLAVKSLKDTLESV